MSDATREATVCAGGTIRDDARRTAVRSPEHDRRDGCTDGSRCWDVLSWCAVSAVPGGNVVEVSPIIDNTVTDRITNHVPADSADSSEDRGTIGALGYLGTSLSTVDPSVTDEHSLQQFIDKSPTLSQRDAGGDSARVATTTNDRFEPNDDFNEATEVGVRTYRDQHIVEGESDFFAIQLAEGESLTAKIYFDHADGDLDLAAYSSSQNRLDSSISTSDNEQVSVTAQEAGTYYVEAYGHAGASESYDLQLRVDGKSIRVRCTVSSDTIAVGEEDTIDASESENAETYRYDLNGNGSFEVATDQATITHSYDETGEYTPRVNVSRIVGERGSESDSADCGRIRVESDNEPPEAAFTISSRPAVAGEDTTLDASASADLDGTIEYYLWDFDGDGTIDQNTTRSVTTHQFPYDASSPGLAVVDLRVVDDDGGEGFDETDLGIVRKDITASCTVSQRSAQPEEEVTVQVDHGPQADQFQYNSGSTGEFEDFTDETSRPVAYDGSGTYTPRVKVWNSSSERSTVVDCPAITVEAGPVPPTAVLAHRPFRPDSGTTVTIDASNSTDSDGTIVAYHWDLNGDGTTDQVTNAPTITYTFDDTGDHPVEVIVVDDDNVTASAQTIIPVEAGFVCSLPVPVPCWSILPIPIIGGLFLCRGLRTLRSASGGTGSATDGGIVAHATGTFETPTDSGTTSVTGLGFEPDLILFTATNNATADGPALDRTDGWTYGKAKRNPPTSCRTE